MKLTKMGDFLEKKKKKLTKTGGFLKKRKNSEKNPGKKDHKNLLPGLQIKKII